MVTATKTDIPECKRSWTVVALALILAAALGIRFWGIGAQSLWHDEVLTTLSASVPFTQVIDSVEHNENKPPLYFFVMNLWVRAAGMSEAALRWPSALFGAAAVWVIYLLGRDLFDDRRVGLIAALLLAFARFHIAYSQEARTYSLMFLLMLLACWLAVRMTRRRATGDQVGYVVCAALAMYAHPFAAFALLAINVYYVACNVLGTKPATDLRRWIILQFAFTLLFAPWLAKTWLVVQTGLPWIIKSTPFPTAILSYAGSAPLLTLLVVLVAVAVTYGLIRRDRGILLLVLLLLLPTLGPLAFASRLYQTFIPRYGIIAVGALLLLAAYGIARLRPWAKALVCVAYVVISLAHFRPGYGNYPGAEPKADIRSVAKHVLANRQGGDAVMSPTRPLFTRPIQHYFRGTLVPVVSGAAPPDPNLYPSLWVAFGVPEGYEKPGRPPGYDLVEQTAFDGVVLYHFVVPLVPNP
jgi:4-amino-4-deoxy-L-arabinose transferase-like glycosyltransferase